MSPRRPRAYGLDTQAGLTVHPFVARLQLAHGLFVASGPTPELARVNAQQLADQVLERQQGRAA